MLDSLNDSLSDLIHSFGWSGQAIFRLLLSALLGGLVGIEREFRGREAGFRTNILVCVGCTLVMLVSMKFADISWDRAGEYQITVDPGRIAYGVMTGIGFLGAGAILKHGASIRGLTTAAALWCIAAIGLASGMGLYVLAIAATLIVMLVLSLLAMLEQNIPARHFRKLTFRCPWRPQAVLELVQRLESADMDVGDRSFRRSADLQEMDVELVVSFVGWKTYRKIEQELAYDSTYKLLASERA